MKYLHKRSPGRPKLDDTKVSIKEIILKQAAQLFLENGYDAVSLDQIAQACGVTKATIYYYYANKANVFAKSMVQLMDHIRLSTSHLLEMEGTLKTRLQLVAEAHIKSKPVDFSHLMREAEPSLNAVLITEMSAAESAVYDVLAGAFRQAIETGEIVEGNPLLLAHAFTAIMMIGNRRPVVELFSSPKETAEEIVTLFWGGAAN